LKLTAAQATSTEGEAQLSRLKSQLELRSHTLSQREIELDERLRSRESTIKELEGHLRASLTMLSKRDSAVTALESRLTWSASTTSSAVLPHVIFLPFASGRFLPFGVPLPFAPLVQSLRKAA
jgi:hypothetical protein